MLKEQGRELQKLRDEVAKLKGLKPKPDIKPSGLDKNTRDKKPSDGKRPGSAKRSKTAELPIHIEQVIQPDFIPEGATFKGYNGFVVQDVIIQP